MTAHAARNVPVPMRTSAGPVPAAGHGYAYEKLKRKIGDYATAAAVRESSAVEWPLSSSWSLALSSSLAPEK